MKWHSHVLLYFLCTQRLKRFDEDSSCSFLCVAWTQGGSTGLLTLLQSLRRGDRGEPTAGSTRHLPLHFIHTQECRRSTGNDSRERGNRFQERLPNERTWFDSILVSDWSQSTAQCWLRKCRRELRHVPSSRKQFDDQNRCCVHRFKVFAARTFTFSHFGAFNVTALPW